MRLGLCCKFAAEPIRFRIVTATFLGQLPRDEQRWRLLALGLENAAALRAAIRYSATHGIGAFRVNSQILPLKTHPQLGYAVEMLPDAGRLVDAFRACGALARQLDIRLSFHPDQFVVLNSPRSDVIRHSIAELAYQAEVAGWIGADVINLHGGGVYGDPKSALHRLKTTIRSLPGNVRQRLTLENDDRAYRPEDLLPVCMETGVPLVYDVHHHRCLPDSLNAQAATERALETWNREPLFHVSSPKNGWTVRNPRLHHDWISPDDVPDAWRDIRLTLDIEAKAKERAIAILRPQLEARGFTLTLDRQGKAGGHGLPGGPDPPSSPTDQR